LVSLHEINIHRGATEGDCLRLAEKQFQQQSAGNSEVNSQANSAPISVACLEVTRQTTTLWQQGAYAHRWPTEIDVICQQWQQVFAV
ncbi:MAG: hypothetical protein K2X63_02595, partial [Burkholderiaceae bacterium]|nr:hypothetical protein [Burkholderiaceae bacterium]